MHTPLDPVGSLDDSSSAGRGRRIQHNRTVYSNEPAVQTGRKRTLARHSIAIIATTTGGSGSRAAPASGAESAVGVAAKMVWRSKQGADAKFKSANGNAEIELRRFSETTR
jgi:hypothetical protein